MTNSTDFLNQKLDVVIDRPLGSQHPKHGFVYKINYGYIPNTKSADGEELDAYVLGINKPIQKIKGTCIAVIRRTNDNDDKLIITPKGEYLSDIEIEKSINFQEKRFKHVILRSK